MSGIESVLGASHGLGRSDQSPARSTSPTTSDELDMDDGREAKNDERATRTESHGGPQTGVKGVRADAAWQAKTDRVQRNESVREANARLEKMALGKDRTWDIDEKQYREEQEAGVKPGQPIAKAYQDKCKDDSDEELEAIRARRLQSIRTQAIAQESRRKRLAGEGDSADESTQSTSHFGHLREVGHDQYVQAIDKESKTTFVVVHIYVKYVHACAMLTSALSSIARLHPRVKFIQIRAGCIGFGSGGLHDIDAEEIDEDTLDEKAEEVVPTLLVYRDAAIVANLVRVDLDPRWGDGSERCIQRILEDVAVIS